MLDDMGTYSPGDFLLFSQETYFRLFELYNQSWWPLHVAAFALGLSLFYLFGRGGARQLRWAAAGLALAWGWTGWAFHLERYATINLAAPYFAILFFIEAALLAGLGAAGAARGWLRKGDMPRIGALMVGYALVVHPFVGFAAGRTFSQLSVFAMTPDPTAIGTLGLLLFVRGWVRWVLLVPALLWCAVAALTSFGLGQNDWIVSAASGVVALVVCIAQRSIDMSSEPAA